MTGEERIAHLEAENAELRAEIKTLRKQLARVLALQHERKRPLRKDSQNSSKPPSTDGPTRKTRSQRIKSGRKTGGQLGHPGSTLPLVEQPDEVLHHRPHCCTSCQHPLEGVAGDVIERRQVQDLPQWRLVVSEHQMEQVCCPQCQQMNRGTFPPEVRAPTQYGVHVRALAVYLHQGQFVPAERTCEALAELCGCELSAGTLARWVQHAASVLKPTRSRLPRASSPAPYSTGMRRACGQGKLHWLHVNSTRWLTHLAWHPKRGHEAFEAIGIWPRFADERCATAGSVMTVSCAHSICGAHLLRDSLSRRNNTRSGRQTSKQVLLWDV